MSKLIRLNNLLCYQVIKSLFIIMGFGISEKYYIVYYFLINCHFSEILI